MNYCSCRRRIPCPLPYSNKYLNQVVNLSKVPSGPVVDSNYKAQAEEVSSN
jgi:hypothetical protein